MHFWDIVESHIKKEGKLQYCSVWSCLKEKPLAIFYDQDKWWDFETFEEFTDLEQFGSHTWKTINDPQDFIKYSLPNAAFVIANYHKITGR